MRAEDPEQQLEEYATALADGVDRALPGWVVRSVERVLAAWPGPAPDDVRAMAVDAGERARVQVGAAVRSLLAEDVDDQRTTPLAVVRAQAVAYPTEVLRTAGVPPVERDGFAEAAFPDDLYGLAPAAWADVDPDLAEIGLAWGAAKAFVHKARHRR